MRRLLVRLCILASHTTERIPARRFVSSHRRSKLGLAALWACAACTTLSSEPLWAGNPNPDPREPLQAAQNVGRFFGVGYSSGYHAHYAQHTSKLNGNKLSGKHGSVGKHGSGSKSSIGWPSGGWLSGSYPGPHRSQALNSATEYWTILSRPEPFNAAAPPSPPAPSAIQPSAIQPSPAQPSPDQPSAVAEPLLDPTLGDNEHAVQPKGESAGMSTGRTVPSEPIALDAEATTLQSSNDLKPAKSSRLGRFLQPEANPDPRAAGSRGSELIKADRSPSDRVNRQP